MVKLVLELRCGPKFLLTNYVETMADINTEAAARPRRVILRFRTCDYPIDHEIMSAFYKLEGLQSTDCYVHLQPQEDRHCHIVIDVHHGWEDASIGPIGELPHEVYGVHKGEDGNNV